MASAWLPTASSKIFALGPSSSILSVKRGVQTRSSASLACRELGPLRADELRELQEVRGRRAISRHVQPGTVLLRSMELIGYTPRRGFCSAAGYTCENRSMQWSEVAALIRQNEVGRDTTIETPYGSRLLCYADLTATGRFLHFVETWVRCLRPYYANTHTSISSTGRIMTELREQARTRDCAFGERSADDVVLLVGAGATAAVNKLVGLLGLRVTGPLSAVSGRAIPQAAPDGAGRSLRAPLQRAALAGVDCRGGRGGPGRRRRRSISPTSRASWTRYADRPLKIGAFSAASNVTGVLTDVPRGRPAAAAGQAPWRCSTTPPRPPTSPSTCTRRAATDIDALVLSTHKFVGGPQASGVLVANRDAVPAATCPNAPAAAPSTTWAGSTAPSIDYSRRLEEREEGGTPAIVGDIRAGVAFLVKEMLGAGRMLEHETALAAARARTAGAGTRASVCSGPADRRAWPSSPSTSMGCTTTWCRCCSITCSASRTGPAAPAPAPTGTACWASIARARSATAREIARGNLGVKPGWVRLTLPYYASEEDLEFILSAVEFIADHGEAFVPIYSLCWLDGVWRHLETPVPTQLPLELTVEAVAAASCTARPRPGKSRSTNSTCARSGPAISRKPTPPPRPCAPAPPPRPPPGTRPPAARISTSCSGSATSTPTATPPECGGLSRKSGPSRTRLTGDNGATEAGGRFWGCRSGSEPSRIPSGLRCSAISC